MVVNLLRPDVVNLTGLCRWGPHLSVMMGGSDIKNEVLRIVSNDGQNITAIFQTRTIVGMGISYEDLCTLSISISDPESTLLLEEMTGEIKLIPQEALGFGGITHDFILTSDFGDWATTTVTGHIDCIGLKYCPCPDKTVNDAFYNNITVSITKKKITGLHTEISGFGKHPITGEASLKSVNVSNSIASIWLHYETYLRSDSVLIPSADTVTIMLNLPAYGRSELIDSIWQVTIADTAHVYIRLDGALQEGGNGDENTGTDCQSEFISIPKVPFIDPCLKDQMQLALTNAYAAYDAYLVEVEEGFKDAYRAHCMGSLTETFDKIYNTSEYHYTLYYYDQAGNLTQTVPPAGVEYLDATAMEAMSDYRYDPTNTPPSPPAHELVSQYRYNSLNQLIWQDTPDANESRFWYDKLGRIVLSQNAEQADDDDGDEVNDWLFSYSLYDELGRIKEVGQIEKTKTTSDESDIADAINDPDIFINPLDNLFYDFITSATRTEITKTYYSVPIFDDPDSPFGTDGQQNVRNRITTVTIQNEWSSDPLVYDYATHYSYDIHGNVNTLIQDNILIASLEEDQQFKRIDYEYDLISGNVLEVKFQEDAKDQFYHKYRYDADNRIYEVITSRDGWIWEREARYFYYRHGPLARTETGDLLVQGTDYAYTLQGWLKGVNAGALIKDRDMGKDGYVTTGNNHRYIGADAMSFTLYYNDVDYDGINDDAGNKFLPNLSSVNYTGAGNELFNGNIMAMSTTLMTPTVSSGVHTVSNVLGKLYTYDQLNRITSSKSYEKSMPDASSFTWSHATNTYFTDKWATNYTYDQNGNILQMNRAGNNATGMATFDMDQLNYEYYPNTNRLRYVQDNITNNAAYTVDIDDQSAVDAESTVDPVDDVYSYDEIGNLIRDDGDGIANIEWTVYGKIKSIDKTSGPDLIFAYDPMGNRIMKHVIPASGPEVYTYYSRDAGGNIMATYTLTDDGVDQTLELSELHIYGSSRLGYIQTNSTDNEDTPVADADQSNMLSSATDDLYFDRYLGSKRYELTNHLGNVLSVITDRCLDVRDGVTTNILYYEADVTAAQDYDPFGMIIVGRDFGINYRFGFNGKESDSEIYGDGNVYDYGFRIYNPRIGKFLSVDPISGSYPWYTPYQFAGNRVIDCIDLDGLERKRIVNWARIAPDGTLQVYKTVVEIEQNVYHEIIGADGSIWLYATTETYVLLDGLDAYAEEPIYELVYNPTQIEQGPKPSAKYDYTKGTDKNKQNEDWDYIKAGKGLAAKLARYYELLHRDYNAPDAKIMRQDFDGFIQAVTSQVGIFARVKTGWIDESTKGWSKFSIKYQEQITGIPAGKTYLLNGVKFDNCIGLDYYDAKGKYAWLLEKGFVQTKFLNQAYRQIKAVEGIDGAVIIWEFAEKEAAEAVQALFNKNNITQIVVKFTPPNF